MNTNIRYRSLVFLLGLLSMLGFVVQANVFADDDDHIPASRIRQGFDIAPCRWI